MTFYKLSQGCSKVYLILLISLLSACAHSLTPVTEYTQPAEITLNDADGNWYAARFSLYWEKGQEPDWYLGTLLGGEVIPPILAQYAQQITCWRVHRRAVHDKTGHVFSFIFYSSEASAAMIYRQLQGNKLLAKLQKEQRLLKVSYDPLTANSDVTLADTSDPVWPETIRKTWPFFMMGASQMWLAQVQILKHDTQKNHAIEARYKIIQNKMTELWQQQGQHSLVHHLSALYAYQPVLTRF